MLNNSQLLTVTALVLMMLCSGNSWSKNEVGNPDIIQSRIEQPSRISLLAKYVIDRGDDEQREFAILTLGAMLDAYSQVLQQSSQSRPRTQAGRKKQITWGWATSQMIASLYHQLRRLEGGAPFILQVDHLHRVLVIIDGQVVEAAGPRFRSQSQFELQVVEFFCLTRDCSWLEPKEPEKSEEEIEIARSLSKGIWLFKQDGRPNYVIGGVIYYEFSSYAERGKKAELSRRITDEIEQFVLMVNKLKDAERTIDWKHLIQSQPDSDNPQLELIKGNSEMRLKIPLLADLDRSDWKRLINWLDKDGIKTGNKLRIRHLARMSHEHLLNRNI